MTKKTSSNDDPISPPSVDSKKCPTTVRAQLPELHMEYTDNKTHPEVRLERHTRGSDRNRGSQR